MASLSSLALKMYLSFHDQTGETYLYLVALEDSQFI